jgi:2-methylcitrate dehydratase PrpD
MDRPLGLRIAEFTLGLDAAALPDDVTARARHCLLDWIGVTIAGAAEPLSRIVREEAADEGGRPEATVLGAIERLPVAQAALVNGTASHALDYDDVIAALLGHPTVAVAPVVFALGETLGARGDALIAAFVAGVEVSTRMGVMIGESHYARGWHATGTVGAFGAAAAAARLMGLDAERTAHAFGIAATQASGLKGMFGTMCKPLHAGHAASIGLRAAALARRGFTSRLDAIECVQGFAELHSGSFEAREDLGAAPEGFHLRNVLFKYHASCYGTHAAIEAARDLRARRPDLEAAALERIVVRVPQAALRMCAIPRPRTGLEAKFSLAFTVGGGLSGLDTAALETFDDSRAADPAVLPYLEKVEVAGDPSMGAFAAELEVHARDGSVVRSLADAGRPETDLRREWSRLEAKFRALVTPHLGAPAAARASALVGALDGGGTLAPLLSTLATRADARRAG